MEIALVQGQKRSPGGRHANERLRRGGFIPAVIYGHGETPETVAVSRHDLDIALGHGQHVIKLKIDGQESQYLVKEVQYDHLQRDPLHVDLMRVDAAERVHVQVRLELRGTPIGTKEGGILNQLLGDLEIECPLLEIPEVIRANVESLKLNQGLHIREIEIPAGMKLLHNPEELVCVVRPPKAEVEAATTLEGVAEPEVIAKGKIEDAEGGAEKK